MFTIIVIETFYFGDVPRFLFNLGHHHSCMGSFPTLFFSPLLSRLQLESYFQHSLLIIGRPCSHLSCKLWIIFHGICSFHHFLSGFGSSIPLNYSLVGPRLQTMNSMCYHNKNLVAFLFPHFMFLSLVSCGFLLVFMFMFGFILRSIFSSFIFIVFMLVT